MNFSKKVSSILLVIMLIITSIPFSVFGITTPVFDANLEKTNLFANNTSDENVGNKINLPNKPDIDTITKSAILASNGTNLLKIAENDFIDGSLNGLTVDVNGYLTLENGETLGVFYSPLYEDDDLNFEYLVSSWNAYLPGKSTIEVEAIAFIAKNPFEDPNVGEWSEYLTWGEWGPKIRSGSKETKAENTNLAYMAIDEFTVRTPSNAKNQGATKVQFKVTLKKDSLNDESPILRQVTASWYNSSGANVGTPAYAEDLITTKSSIRIEAPAYSQIVRDPAIGGSICNPTTLTVMLNQRDPGLDLLPEELALTVQDFEYGFGNWSYTGSSPGLYGYESYAQYGNFEILRQELSKGNTVGMSVRYSSHKNGTYPYLETGATNSTGGHLITITGFYYDDNLEDYVYYSSDSAAPTDYTTSGEHRRYQEKHLKEACKNSKNLLYIIPSKIPVSDKISGIEKIDATFEPTSNINEYKLIANGENIKLDPSFILKKQDILKRGTLAFTIDGIKTTMPEYVIKDLTANNTFFYNNISVNNSGNIEFDVNEAFRENNIPVGEKREVTFYVMINTGETYKAKLVFERDEDIYVSANNGYCDVLVADNNIDIYGEITNDSESLKLSIKAPNNTSGDVNAALDNSSIQLSIVNGYITLDLDSKKAFYDLVVNWDTNNTKSYKISTRDIIVPSKHMKSEKNKNLITIKGDEFTNEQSYLYNVFSINKILTVGSNETGYYYSPVYDVDTFRYIVASWEAITPGKSSIEVEIRAHRVSHENSWTGWYSYGEWGTGIKSTSKKFKDIKGNMDVDVLSLASADLNADKFQIRVTFKADNDNIPELYGVTVSFIENQQTGTKADISGNIKDAKNFKAYSAYSYFSEMKEWRFENMMLMLLNNQGADLLFEEVALNGFDFGTGAGNWAFTPSKAKTFGYTGFLQYGANTDIIKQYIKDGIAVGILANTKDLNATSKNITRPVIVYNYDENTSTFSLVCPSGDAKELIDKDVYFQCSETKLQEAITSCGNAPGRSLMFVVGSDSSESNSFTRTKATLKKTYNLTYSLLVNDKKVSLTTDFITSYKSKSGGGLIMYSLESENPSGSHKLAERKYYYDITIDTDGDIILTEDLQRKIDGGEIVQVFVVSNNGITYEATLGDEADTDTSTSSSGDSSSKSPSTSKNNTSNNADTQTYIDVYSNMWYYDAVNFVTTNKIMQGTSTNQFSPDLSLTREMAVTILYRYAKEPVISSNANYTDVKNSDYFYNAVSWATQNEIVKGYGNNIFGTGHNLTREDFAVIMYRYAQFLNKETSSNIDLSKFTDSNKISSWAVDALKWANDNDLIKGKTDTTLAPKDAITRAETATIIMRYNNLLNK